MQILAFFRVHERFHDAADLQTANAGGCAGTRHPEVTRESHSTLIFPCHWCAHLNEVVGAMFLLFAMPTSRSISTFYDARAVLLSAEIQGKNPIRRYIFNSMFTSHRFRYFVTCPTIFRVLATSEMPSRILIADDSALLRSALRGLFDGIGDYEILEAESGTEAVAKTNECRPNLIILDFAMPGMDGLKVARILQNSLPEIPIVMYTMHYTEQLSAAALAAGAKQVISKSETGSLISKVQELLTPSEDAPKPAPVPAIDSKVKELAFDTPIARTGTQAN